MRIVIITAGSLGDVLPYISLGYGLQSVGFEVTINTHSNYMSMIRSAGLHYEPLRGDPYQLISWAASGKWLKSHNNPVIFTDGLLRTIGPLIAGATTDCLEASKTADALITSEFGLFVSYSVAEKLQLPLIQAYLKPITPTKHIVNSLLPLRIPPENTHLRELSHIFFQQLFWQLSRTIINRIRRDILMLPTIPITGPFTNLQQKHSLILYGYSPSLLPRPSDWKDFIHITGYWFPRQSSQWKPDHRLVEFIESGSPPIFVGLGSLDHVVSEDKINKIIEAIIVTKQRAIFQTNQKIALKLDEHDLIQITEYIPHDWLFPRMSVVIHHGGAGTTAAGLRAGIPTITIPFTADQPFWGYLLYANGVGTMPLPFTTFQISQMVLSIRECLNNEKLKKNARKLGEQITREDGIKIATALIQDYLD